MRPSSAVVDPNVMKLVVALISLVDDLATLTISTFVFLEEGDIAPTGSENFHVWAGSVKFNVEVNENHSLF